MSQKIAAVKGMNDLLPGELSVWHHAERVFRETLRRIGYREIRTPILEDTGLFVRSVGEETDIVGKEMYTFADKAGRSLSLRPEGTAPAARAYIEHAVQNQEPVTHWFYLGPMFRYERMKTGRYRQFWQLGAEAYGVAEAEQDVELMEVAVRALQALDLSGVKLHLNSLGDEACRPAYQEALVAYFRGREADLCEDCKRRLDRNPLRILDCKNPRCQEVAAGAPVATDFLCAPCREHFDQVKGGLDALAVPYELDTRMVRGLDYYTRTVFELIASDPVLGTASAVGAGGRYDKLVRSLGGPDVPAVGFAMGLDRVCLLLSQTGRSFEQGPALFVVSADAAGKAHAAKLASALRQQGLWVETDARGGSVKSQMKRADKSGAAFVLVLGAREVTSGSAELKPLRGGEGRTVTLKDLPGALGPNG